MKYSYRTMFRLGDSESAAALTMMALTLLLCPAARAQTSLPAAQQIVAPPGRPDQKIERIRTEDAGSRIDEIRVGGQTQSITVQPKTGDNLPAYEVKPTDNSRGFAPPGTSGGTTGSRIWNVFKF